ncbi:MAG: helix-turn-helix domain-containing protein [Myxococcota bacterium]|jgi:transcriptional regulator with XRE-family HTH domain
MTRAADMLAHRLRALRLARGLTQQELADRAGMSLNAVGAYERGDRWPRPDALDQLVVALGSDIDDMLGPLLVFRDPAGSDHVAVQTPLRQLALLLEREPERRVEVILNVARVLLDGWPRGAEGERHEA